MPVHHMINDFLVGDGFFSMDVSIIKIGSGTVSFINGSTRTVNFTPDIEQIRKRGIIKEHFDPIYDPNYSIYCAMKLWFE